ncbi:Nmad5 family putative nucleotide modification protein [Castellaniella sp.]|uniref:Nmad5 family putative nucleotide modification protein n=1 Tax=Castellaniella sp. TaxID=1955812 RepID=UPI002AFE3B2F|nr:Nmad5 family putative nucleotide modification protein [Castellaniella sp.]
MASTKTNLTMKMRDEILWSVTNKTFAPRVEVINKRMKDLAQSLVDKHHKKYFELAASAGANKAYIVGTLDSGKFKYSLTEEGAENIHNLSIRSRDMGSGRYRPELQRDVYRNYVTVKGPTSGDYNSNVMTVPVTKSELERIKKLEKERDAILEAGNKFVSELLSALASVKTVAALYELMPELRSVVKVPETNAVTTTALVPATKNIVAELKSAGLLKKAA